MSEDKCTCCDDTGTTLQTERPCSCAAGVEAMTKPTITDEDRALAEFVIGRSYREVDLEKIAAYRQAAFNAGLERAAVIAEEEYWFAGDTGQVAENEYNQAVKEVAAAIRAEKEKPQ